MKISEKITFFHLSHLHLNFESKINFCYCMKETFIINKILLLTYYAVFSIQDKVKVNVTNHWDLQKM